MSPQYMASDVVQDEDQPKKLSKKQEAEMERLAKEEDEKRKEILNGLAMDIERMFQQRANQRLNKDGEWDSCYRLYHAPLVDGDNFYSDRPFEAKPGRKRPTPNVVRVKCDTAIANSYSMQFAADEKNWDIFPPPNNTDPDIPDRCRAMDKEIQTQLISCNYPLQARMAMEDRVILGTGVLKGPVNTGKMAVKYVKQGDTWVPQVVKDYSPTVERVPPWRFFPDMDVPVFDPCSEVIQYHPTTKQQLARYIKHPGFDGEAIKEILQSQELGDPAYYNNSFLTTIDSKAWSNAYMHKERFAVLEYHGTVAYDDVDKLGLCPTYESPTDEYYAEVWVCAGKVIRMQLENIEAQYRVPFYVSTWKDDPRSPFGFGHPLLLADSQRVVTESYHMILDNASLTSGPQVSMFQQYVQPVDNDYTIRPNKIWLLNDPTVSIKDAINFFTPTNVIPNIMPVLQLAKSFGDEESATTAMAAGLASPDNVDSATGQMIMKHSSTTILDFLAEEWDDQVTEPLINAYYAWNMQYNPKDEIKGDFVVDVKSSSEYKNKQMHIRDLERLSVEASQNKALAMWVNMGELQKARLALMHLPSNKIVRSQEEYDQAVQQDQQNPDPQMIELQIKMADAQRADRELQLKEAELKLRAHQEMQAAQWEHEQKQGSNFARVQEAQAQVIKARAEVEAEIIKLSAKDRQLAMQLQTQQLSQQNATDAKVFMHSMTESRKAVEAQLTANELAYAKEHGKGI